MITHLVGTGIGFRVLMLLHAYMATHDPRETLLPVHALAPTPASTLVHLNMPRALVPQAVRDTRDARDARVARDKCPRHAHELVWYRESTHATHATNASPMQLELTRVFQINISTPDQGSCPS